MERRADRSLANPQIQSERIRALQAPHMTKLNAYVEGLRARKGDVPFFDPFDGGSGARLLLLLETPGRSAAAIRFTSRDNPTGTARTLRRMFDGSGIDRYDTAIWNAVPWVIQTAGKRLRAPRAAERKDGASELGALLENLPHLEVLILAGRVAQRLEESFHRLRPAIAIFGCPHPSPVYVNTSPAIPAQIEDVFARAARIVRPDHARRARS